MKNMEGKEGIKKGKKKGRQQKKKKMEERRNNLILEACVNLLNVSALLPVHHKIGTHG